MATDDERSELVCARSLLRPGAGPRLEQALATYPAHYDEVLHAVHSRLMDHGAATKLDLAALIAWKHVRNAPSMRKLLALPDVTVEAITRGAFRIELKDADRIAALDPLPGFGAAGAFTSVLLAAWDPSRFGVFDQLVFTKRHSAVSERCQYDWSHLPTYWAHLRVVVEDLRATSVDASWTPRAIDMALMNL